MRAFCLTLSVTLLVLTAGSCQPPPARGGTKATGSTDSVPASLAELIKDGKSLAACGEYAMAAELFERGYREAVQIGSRDLELLFLTYLANTQNLQYQFRSAIENYLRGRRIAEASGSWEMVVVIESNIAGLYLAQGATEEASRALENAKEALAKVGDSTHLASIRLLEAKLHASRGDSDYAIALYRQAVVAADRGGDESVLGRALDLLGYELLEADRVGEAELVLLEAFRRRSMLDPPVPSVSYLNLGLVRLRQGDTKGAATLVDQAFLAMAQGPQWVQPWVPYLARAQVRMTQSDLKGAYEDMEQALHRVRRLRLAILPTHSVRAGARAGLNTVHSTFIEVASRLHFASGSEEPARRAFEVAEQHRAIALRESLEEASELRERLPADYWTLLGEVGATERSLMRNPGTALRQRLGDLETRLTELEVQAGIGSSEARLLSGAALNPVSLEMVQRALSPSEALFGFQLGEETSYLWALTRGHFELHRLPGSEEIGAQARSFRDGVQRSSMAETSRRGAELYETLFGPVSEAVRVKPDWILLPDGALFDVPFAALVSGPDEDRPVFLIERHSLRVLPSAAMLLEETEEAWNGPFVAVGDPIYNEADPRWQSPEQARGWGEWLRVILGIPAPPAPDAAQLSRLVGSASEAGACARAYGSPHPPILLFGEGASVSALRGTLSTHPSVIHLATHVVPSPGHAQDGKIALSLSGDGATELLGAATVANWDTRSALVVMSGCRSGSGTVLPGEGLLGLTRAWLRAGARNVAATLWPTPDTRGDLLRSLYRHLSDNDAASAAPAKALQLAQIDMLRSKEWGARLDHWATYFMVSRE